MGAVMGKGRLLWRVFGLLVLVPLAGVLWWLHETVAWKDELR